MKDFIRHQAHVLSSAILAGICISIGGFVNLSIGGIEGAILFSFGLLSVVHYALHLYTGKAGFFDSWKTFFELFFVVLIGNVIGCWLTAELATSCGKKEMIDAAAAIVQNRYGAGLWTNMLMAIPCGFIMTTAVEFGKKGKFLPLLFGVPVFILCGFRHSIADAFYYLCVPFDDSIVMIWLMIVLGNFIGCNLYRVLLVNDSE